MDVNIGLDIGGTKILAAAADNLGVVHERLRAATPIGLDAGLDRIHQMVRAVAGPHRVRGIGAAIGGPLDWEKGVVSPLHQPGWRGVPLRSIMEERFGCPFHVDVDTNVAALGEYSVLVPPPARLLYLTLSTGMGGGFLLDGAIYRGAGGSHPEVAHQAIPFRCSAPERVACECGAPDCLEALVSGNGIRRIYQKPAEKLTEGEWEEVAYNLGQGLRNLAAIYAPEVIVLGGGVALGGGDRLLAGADLVLKERLKLVPQPKVQFTLLGEDTALAGALILARQGLVAL
jgi:predicted NBD/HSP70 family sugar kinase